MAKFVHSDVLDNGLNAIKSNANVQHLIKAYAAGDSYATVVGNSIGNVAMASGDYTLASSGNNRTLTTAAGKTTGMKGAAASGEPLGHHHLLGDAGGSGAG